MLKKLLKHSKKQIFLYLILFVLLGIGLLELLSRSDCADIYKNYESPCPKLLIENIFDVTGNLPLAYPESKQVTFNDINNSEFFEKMKFRTFYAPQSQVRANGLACFNYAFISSDLPEKAKRYVSIHENIHLEGEYNEARTNYLAARMEPIGFVETVVYSVWVSLKKTTFANFPCQLGRLWNIFKIYFIKI